MTVGTRWCIVKILGSAISPRIVNEAMLVVYSIIITVLIIFFILLTIGNILGKIIENPPENSQMVKKHIMRKDLDFENLMDNPNTRKNLE